MLTAEWLHLVLYYSTEYHNSRQNILIQFLKYLVDIRSEAWLILFCEFINGKLFTVHTGQYGFWYLFVILMYYRVFIFTLASAERGSPPPVDFIVTNIPKPLSMTCGWKNGIARATAQLPLRCPSVRISASCLFDIKSYLGRRLRDCNFFCLFWRLRLVFASLYFTHAEYTLKKCATHVEHALKNMFSHAQPTQK